jgi:hypothetical protein
MCARATRDSAENCLMPANAVGTPITECPPHRSLRARFAHKAPTSGV